MENKRGQGTTIPFLVAIVLALIVIVVIIYGFTVGWGNLFQNILGFGGGQVNVQTIVSSCQVACSTQATFDYCTKVRNVVFEEGGDTISATCFALEDSNPNRPPVPNVGLPRCQAITCNAPVLG